VTRSRTLRTTADMVVVRLSVAQLSALEIYVRDAALCMGPETDDDDAPTLADYRLAWSCVRRRYPVSRRACADMLVVLRGDVPTVVDVLTDASNSADAEPPELGGRCAAGVLARLADRVAVLHERFADCAGFVDAVRNTRTGDWTGIYESAPQGFDGEDKYMVVCEKHGGLVSVPTIAAARWAAADTVRFCGECQKQEG